MHFDRDLKVEFDTNVKDPTLCKWQKGPCMVSMQLVLLEDAVTSDAKMQAGRTSTSCKRRMQSERGFLASFV